MKLLGRDCGCGKRKAVSGTSNVFQYAKWLLTQKQPAGPAPSS